MVVVFNGSFISLRTIIEDKPEKYLLDSGALHNFLALGWHKEKGLKIDKGEQFGVKLADGYEVPAVGKVQCLVDLGPMKTEPAFHVIYCNVPCVLRIPFLQTVNPAIDWATCSVQVCMVSGISSLEIISSRVNLSVR